MSEDEKLERSLKTISALLEILVKIFLTFWLVNLLHLNLAWWGYLWLFLLCW